MTRYAAHSDRYDLRRVIARITRAIDLHLERTPEGQTLFVGIGEDHQNSVHPIIQQLVLQQLQEKGIPIAFGYELWHTAATNMLAENFGYPEARTLPLPFQQTDPDGQRALSIFLSKDSYVRGAGDVAADNLYIHALASLISFRFNDAAIIKGTPPDRAIYTDPNDSEILRIFKDGGLNLKQSGMNPDGMHIRNSVMVDRSIRHARESGARVYLFHTGTFHLAGGRCDTGNYVTNNPFEYSLLSKFWAAGHHAIGILPTSRLYDGKDLTAEGITAVKDGKIVPIASLPQSIFRGKDAEMDYIRMIAKESGGELIIYDHNEWQQKCLETTQANAGLWMEETKRVRLDLL